MILTSVTLGQAARISFSKATTHRVHRVFFGGFSGSGRGQRENTSTGIRCLVSEHRVCKQRALVGTGSECWAFTWREKDGTETHTNTHRYLLAIFLLIQGQTNIQTRAAQTSDPAKVMRKMAHTGSISIPSTEINKHTHV